MTAYADRERERGELRSSLFQKNNKITYLEAFKACGITSFIKDFMSIIEEKDDYVKTIYIDMNRNKKLPIEVAATVFTKEFDTKIQSYIDEKIGSKDQTFIQSLISIVPNIGSLLGYVTQKKSALPVEFTYYNTVLEEILIDYFTDVLRESIERKVIIFLDNVQYIHEDDFDILKQLLLQTRLNFVLIETEKNDQIIKLSNHLYSRNNSQTTIIFLAPHNKLIVELAQLENIDLNEDEANTILEEHKQNIHTIVNHIKQIKHPNKNHSYSLVEKNIVQILLKSEISIEFRYLNEIVCRLPNTLEILPDQFVTSIERLLAEQVISEEINNFGDKFYKLNTSNHPLLISSDLFFYEDAIYTYFSKLDSSKLDYTLINLLYNLSKKLELTTVSRYAKKKLFIEIKTQNTLSKELFSEAALSTEHEDDCVYAAIFYCKHREYKQALEWIDYVNINENLSYRILRATLLSRCKRQKDAIEELKRCIKITKNRDLKCLLNSYLISTLIHSNKLVEAKKIYSDVHESIKDSKNYGYLLRNGMTLFSKKIEVYNCALDSFKQHNDLFGYYSTLANRGKEWCEQGNYEQSLLDLNDTVQELSKFGNRHLYVVFNNRGICQGLKGDFPNALSDLSIAERFSNDSMPIIFSKINYACMKLYMGEKKQALEILKKIEEEVATHPIDRVRQKYYPNRLFAEYANQTSEIFKYEELCGNYPDRSYPEKTRQFIDELRQEEGIDKLSFDTWKKYFQPCYLAYWYVDPLQLFVESF
ncbi:hypothetical protein [Enterococcus rotai]|uniref:hypothetical protein n=1 Tax=Enterococcus rotai TaxID=118060 RepID=UPI0035C682CC